MLGAAGDTSTLALPDTVTPRTPLPPLCLRRLALSTGYVYPRQPTPHSRPCLRSAC